MSSHDVVAVVRRALRDMKVGHTGTLDPFATGVLVLLVGRATRLAQFLADAEKEYLAGVRLGRATDSYDLTGATTFEVPADQEWPTIEHVTRLLADMTGPRMQVPPQFSAKMADGTRAYEQARKGIAVDLAPAAVELRQVEILGLAGTRLDIRIRCSSGFYVRSLAHDLGARLGVGAHLEELRRTKNGTFDAASAITLDLVPGQGPSLLARITPLEALLTDLPAVHLNADGFSYVVHGRDITPLQAAEQDLASGWSGRVRLIGPDGALLAVADAAPGPVLHPAVVLV